jgi:hypothetical protein
MIMPTQYATRGISGPLLICEQTKRGKSNPDDWDRKKPQSNAVKSLKLNGSSTRYSSSGLLKNAQICDRVPSAEPPSRIWRFLSPGAFPRKLTLASVRSTEVVLLRDSDAFQNLLAIAPDRLLSTGFISWLRFSINIPKLTAIPEPNHREVPRKWDIKFNRNSQPGRRVR